MPWFAPAWDRRSIFARRKRAIPLLAFLHSYGSPPTHGEISGQTPTQQLLADVHKVTGSDR
jgi:hypothetical protein